MFLRGFYQKLRQGLGLEFGLATLNHEIRRYFNLLLQVDS